MTDPRVLRVAAVQAASLFPDASATVEKAIGRIEEAAAAGAGLVAFGEAFAPGHPVWMHVLPVTSGRQIELAAELVDGAIRIPGPETAGLAEAARRTGVTVVIGAVERLSEASSAIASVALVVTPDGTVASRRKLVPAVGERVLFTPGDGDSIRTFDTPYGRLSVLLGGENSNPLLTWTMREMGARIHVAAWPPHFHKPGVMSETASITGRAIAYQNTAHVISVAGCTSPDLRDRIAETPAGRGLLDQLAADPLSSVYAPRGAVLAGPLAGGEGILYADLDLSAGAWASLVNRHYDRPDLFRVTVDRSARRAPLAFAEEGFGLAGGDAILDRTATTVEARARRLIEDRYGSELTIEDQDRLLPFVVGVLEASTRLAELERSTMDPATTAYVDDARGGT
jgi:predicted amidohydrolase